jgi:uncharacterized protein
MIIDFHTHIFPPEIVAQRSTFIARDPWFAELYGNPKAKMATADDLVASMTQHGITHAVTFGFGWRDAGIVRLANDYVLDAVSRFSQLTGFAVVQPTDPGALNEIERCTDSGLRGIGELMPHGQGYRLSDIHLLSPLMTVAAERNLFVLTHVSESVGHMYPGKGNVTLEDFLAFLQAFPHVRVIAAHWGGGLPFFHLMPEVAAAAANCWYDTAASPYLYHPDIFRSVIASAGSDRILWATDYPLIGYPRMLAYLDKADLDVLTREDILGGNAAQLLW